MKHKNPNALALHIWIAENGGLAAKAKIYKDAQINQSTLSRILSNGHIPKFEARHRIYKLTGIKLSDEDDYSLLEKSAS